MALTQPVDPVRGLGLTAILVTGARAAESARPGGLFDDPLAPIFIESARAASPNIAQALAGSPDEGVNQARRDSVAVRTRFCDDYLLAAAQSGCRQIVLLAAGLDARAFRLPWPGGTRLWEIDMPDVFAFKERVIANRGATPACERTVIPADLREDWPPALIDAGFRPAQPAAWLIEGLLMYLDEGERDLLMNRVGAISAAGSRIALDHRGGFFSPPPVTTADDPSGAKAAVRFASLAAAASSDPSLTAPEAWFASHGWRANVLDAAAIFMRYDRPVPPQTQPATRAWMATAERV
ncbi:MAG TPA: SAM-dependent methyltransferase [Bryobacteraceae bacterium]|jgi:methyltransferase (TIGR00027 family)|nr:SAM-dependent methyltransferase [Bryobacteraceae bacterium]